MSSQSSAPEAKAAAAVAVGPTSGMVSELVAGSDADWKGFVDGSLRSCRFTNPIGVTVYKGAVYVADHSYALSCSLTGATRGLLR
jgi:hypothetical protein